MYPFRCSVLSNRATRTDSYEGGLFPCRCYTFAEMPWYQRRIAEMLLATPPSSTYEEVVSRPCSAVGPAAVRAPWAPVSGGPEHVPTGSVLASTRLCCRLTQPVADICVPLRGIITQDRNYAAVTRRVRGPRAAAFYREDARVCFPDGAAAVAF